MIAKNKTASSSPHSTISNAITVMVVDNDPVIHKKLEKDFISRKYTYLKVLDPLTILKSIKTGKPDIIFINHILGIDKEELHLCNNN